MKDHTFITKPELLAPAGNTECLTAALHFGADAVYLAGKQFGLRAGADNFTDDELRQAVLLCHAQNKKAYVTANIFAHNTDFKALPAYLAFLSEISVDGLIIADPGVLTTAKKCAPDIPIHLSTQANTTNAFAAAFWAEQGVKRIVAARELTLPEIKQMRECLPLSVEIEAFVHGAMCVAYSGRCLLSGVLTGRSGNRGACAQSCRWAYEIREKSRSGEYLTLSQDEKGSYILNSKDMNLLAHLDKLYAAGITSFKIEGRAKGAYYTANTVNAYRRAIDRVFCQGGHAENLADLETELYKSAHRRYFTGFYLNGEKGLTDGQYAEASSPEQTHQFVAAVTGTKGNLTEIEQRNRFAVGDTLEILSPDQNFNQTFTLIAISDAKGHPVEIANLVQQKLYIDAGFTLQNGDMLRKKTASK